MYGELDRDALDRWITSGRYSSSAGYVTCSKCETETFVVTETEYGSTEWFVNQCPQCGTEFTGKEDWLDAEPEPEWEPTRLGGMMTEESYMYYDGSEEPQKLRIGDRVHLYGEEFLGTVVRFDELDADYNDELQRAESYGPYCYVKWDDEEGLDQFTGYYTMSWAMYPDGPDKFFFDDIVKVDS